jgi:hypothetical protein
VIQVLSPDDDGCTAKEILEQIVARHLYNFRAKDPVGVVRGAIRKHLRGTEKNPRVVQVARDRFRRAR